MSDSFSAGFQPKFTITHNLLTYISSIESAKALIDHAALVPAWEAKFRDDARVRTVHFGTKIEGNDLSAEQAEQLLKSPVTVNAQAAAQESGIIARDRDIQEVLNYRQVLAWIDQWSDFISDPSHLTEDILKTLHSLSMQSLLAPSEIGNYRQKQVVVQSATDGGVVFRPPLATEVPELISDFFNWLNSAAVRDLHPIIRAAITHYQIVYIHPFIEGNGRTARALATLVLYISNYDFKRFFSLEKYFDDDVEKYYQALLSVQQHPQQELTYWLEYFCYGLAIEVDKVKQQVLKLSKDVKLKQELGQQVALSERQIILLELLQQNGQISSKDAQEVLPHVSVDTVLRDLKDLLQKGVVEKHGVTKGVTYKLHQ